MSKMFQKGDKPDDPPPPYSTVIKAVTSIKGDAIDPDLSMEINALVNNQGISNDKTLMVTIKPTPGVSRTPVHICCVVDISGSMGETATFRNDEGSIESDGLTILDLVVHAIKTVISTMTEADYLSIVSFSTDARLELPSTAMDSAGKCKAIAKIESLQPEASTNLWAGLELGWDTIRGNKLPRKMHSLFLFTDGMPNVIPPRGHLPMIKMYMDKHNGPPCTLNTFGFGYSLESDLLDEIARTCDGSFVFIPDSSFVGTAFINATANLYTVMAENVSLRLQLPDKGMQITVKGGHNVTDTTWGKSIRVGNVHFDQTREFILNLENAPQGSSEVEYFTIFLDYTIIPNSTTKVPQIECIVKSLDWESPNKRDHTILCQYLRCQFVDCVEECNKPNDDISSKVQSIKASVTLDLVSEDPFIKALREDVDGQVVEALSSEFYQRWGKHYLFSLADAHRSQVCNNFKDPGVQFYGGPLFRALRDNFDETFNALPPPKPKRKGTRVGPIHMAYYNTSRGPCFHGNCLVQMANGSRKLVRDVCKGDQIMTMDNTPTKVLCILKTPIFEGFAEMVEFPEGLLITPYHPVYEDKSFSWRFPIDMYQTVIVPCDAVFSFALESSHSMIINDVSCVTLGHGVKGDVREHSYFGTHLILDDLKMSGGWDDGLVIGGKIVRSFETNLVSCIKMSAPKTIEKVDIRNEIKASEGMGRLLILN